MSYPPITAATCVIRNTGAAKGRTRYVAPGGATAARHLHYGRIVLGAGDAPVQVDPKDHETGLVCLAGRATVRARGHQYELVPYDSMYIPHHSPFEVAAGRQGCDLAEMSAPVTGDYPLQFVSFEAVRQDRGLHFATGGVSAQREVNLLLAKNVDAGRIVCGVTFSAPGNWTSWPPHEHTAMLEEAYLYVDMPAPAFAIQMVYTNPVDPELVAVVREGDVVLMPQGYHPNVAAPGGRIGFLWMMVAEREGVDRQFGVVNVQPEFAELGSGLDAGRAK